jgi:YD repeat-containing protein
VHIYPFITRVRENGATSGVGLLAAYAYDDLGRRTSLTRGNGTVTSYAFDPVSRLSSLSHDSLGTVEDVTTIITVTRAYLPIYSEEYKVRCGECQPGVQLGDLHGGSRAGAVGVVADDAAVDIVEEG